MHDSEALRCCYCNAIISAGDDAQPVSKREVARTARAFAVNDAFFIFTFDAESERDDDAS